MFSGIKLSIRSFNLFLVVVGLMGQQVSLHLTTKKVWKNGSSTLLLGRLGVKAAEMLPAIIGANLSWILHKAVYVVGWVSQNLWALIVGTGGLLYTYMITRQKELCMIIKFSVRDNTRLLQFQSCSK